MKKHFVFFFKLVFFYFMFFFIYRICFFVFFIKKFLTNTFSENLKSFVYGYKLDLSTISYFLIPCILIWLISQSIFNKTLNKIHFYFHALLIVITSLIFTVNLKLYNEWETLFNYRALSYAMYPKEMLASMEISSIVESIIILFSLITVGIILFKKFIPTLPREQRKLNLIAPALILPGLMVIALRGGLQLIPVNESSAYFSDRSFNNHLAINPVWYIGNNYLENKKNKNPFIFFDSVSCEEVKMVQENNSTQSILRIQKPNIILVVLESFSSDFIQSLGGFEDVTPVLDSLSKEGLLFTNIYSSGFRTEQGIVSILSGFPSVPNHSVIRFPEKIERLPSMAKDLKEAGYATSFYYGGDLNFGKINLYLKSTGFEKLVDQAHFSAKQKNSKWGAHDEYVFEKALEENNKQPFLKVIMTLSNHEPFEVPITAKFPGEQDSEKFKNSAYYTDYCIGEFLKKAKTKSWFQNSLFVFVADHGHFLPKGRSAVDPLSRKVPILFYGPALVNEYKNLKIDLLGNHHDLPLTLLQQLRIKKKQTFSWSKDLLHKEMKEFAFFAHESGYGWITPKQNFVYLYPTNETILEFNKETHDIDSLELLKSKKYMQCLYTDFLNL